MTRFLITGARAPAALHLARLLHGAGHHIVMADSLAATVGAVSKACAAFVHLPAATGAQTEYGQAVEQAISAHDINIVVPTCEEVFHLADLWKRQKMNASLFAPALPLLAEAHNKFAFIQRAKSLGLAVPHTRLLTSQADVSALHAQSDTLVFKPVWSRFATEVLIRPEKVSIAPTKHRPWVAQAFVDGTEICAYAIAHNGRLAALSAYRPTYRAGGGAGIAFVPDHNPDVAAFVERFVTATGWTGQTSFDFIRPEGGPLQAIECNPRATSGVHFFRESAHFSAAFLGDGRVEPDAKGLLAVKAALAFYGPFQRPTSFVGDFRRAKDVMAWPDDPRPARRQFAATCEIARLAWRHRIGLVRATTFDIAWDGPASDQSS